MYRKQVRRRRAVLAVLVIVAVILLSASFGETQSGPLHSIQSGFSTIFAPIEEGASRVLKPVRDLFNWFDETFDARGENDDLHAEVDQLRQELANKDGAIAENTQLRKLVNLDQSGTLAGYEPVTARVIVRSPTVWYSTVQLDHGSSSGVAVDDPVVTGDGLVGRVTGVTSGTSEVTLIPDPRSAVSARVEPTGPLGVVKTEVGNPTDLLLDFIQNDATVKVGSTIVTSGTTASN